MIKIIICFLILGAQVGHAATKDLSHKLIELRADVQNLADQLDAEKKSLNASIQALTIEKGELESRKKLLSLQNKEMRKTLAQKEKIMDGMELEGLEGYAEVINKGSEELMAYFNQAIPFKIEARKQKIENLQKKFQEKEITVSEYLEKYWSSLQDEIRLTESVEIQNDNIKISEKEYQVKVMKFGMYQMYFKTYEGQLGYAQNLDGKWSFKFFNNSKMSKGVDLLFSAKEKQIKGGNFNLPIVFHQNGRLIGQSTDRRSKESSEVTNVL